MSILKNAGSVDDLRLYIKFLNPENMKDCYAAIHNLVNSLIDEMEHRNRTAALRILESKIKAVTKQLEKFKKDKIDENILRSTGKMFPITPEQIRAFEKLGIHHEMPAEFDDPEALFQSILRHAKSQQNNT